MNAQNMCCANTIHYSFRNIRYAYEEMNDYLDFLVSLATLNGKDDRLKEVIRLV
jgi:hypothetical protein